MCVVMIGHFKPIIAVQFSFRMIQTLERRGAQGLQMRSAERLLPQTGGGRSSSKANEGF